MAPRPDLLALWDFGDPAATEARFRALLPAARLAAAGADPDAAAFLAALLTQIARTEGLQRRFDDAHRTLDEAEAVRVHDSAGEARVFLLLERGRVLNSSGQAAGAKPLFAAAWDLARAMRLEVLAVDAAHMTAIVESPERAIEWNVRALQLAESSSEPRARRWRGSLLNNLGWAFHARGDLENALDAFERALAARREEGTPEQARIARWCIARCLRSLGRFEDALAIQEALWKETEAAGASDGFVREELGECLLALGRAPEARAHFAAAHALLSKDAGLATNEAPRLERMRGLAAAG